MLLKLEALKARHGDCLIVHYGSRDRPKRVLIDGGAARVYDEFLTPRLEELRGDEEFLTFEMLLISHIDDDHLNGVLDMTRELKEASELQQPIPYRFRNLWHNCFDDVVGDEGKGDALLETASRRLGGLATLNSQELPDSLPVERDSALVLCSVAQGRTLRLDAEALGLRLNRVQGQDPGRKLVTAGADHPMGDGLTFRVLCPSERRIAALQKAWDRHLVEKDLDEPVSVAAFVDSAVANLASLVVLAEMGGRSLLLTGDARGDDLLEGLEARGLLENGPLHVDVFKLPHHGSERNVAPILFEKVQADHYLVSGDGRHGNPEPATFKMILDSRQPAAGAFHLHLTYGPEEMIHHYPVAELHAVFEQGRRRGLEFEVHTPGAGTSLTIDFSES
ncbi:MAG: hypothetical protein AAF725_01290 [Acidobacteriota bacterium]